MSRLRFSSAAEVFDAFPKASEDIKAAPTDQSPPAYMRALAASETPEDALTFCAYALGRREAVWWGCTCLREILSAQQGDEDVFLRAAERWVREPEDEHRRSALHLGMRSDQRSAAAWLALAAGWSGGSISLQDGPAVAAPPYMTALGVRSALLIALARVGVRERMQKLSACVGKGLALMEDRSTPS